MTKRILAAFLSVCLLLCFAGCENRQSQTDDQTDRPDTVQKEKIRSNVMEFDEETGEDYYLIGDFESYFECSQIKITGGRLTQIKKSENPELVTYGEQSLQVVVPAGELDVALRMATDTAFFNETTDFSNLKIMRMANGASTARLSWYHGHVPRIHRPKTHNMHEEQASWRTMRILSPSTT